jgi:DNA-binding winged helix-turn-helix (wHTH) protein
MGRAVGVLTARGERPNEGVPKSRILDAAWPSFTVEEANFAVQISSIRGGARADGGLRAEGAKMSEEEACRLALEG